VRNVAEAGSRALSILGIPGLKWLATRDRACPAASLR
jgi:hypothetical protein